jgi:hypothetical protein
MEPVIAKSGSGGSGRDLKAKATEQVERAIARFEKNKKEGKVDTRPIMEQRQEFGNLLEDIANQIVANG